MTTNFQKLGIKGGCLYEILATTFSKKNEEIIPNASCMGIRIKDNNTIHIIPYPDTNTYKNLKENGLICINFVENVYIYALAALKGPYLSEKYIVFPMKYYNYYNLNYNYELTRRTIKIPFIKSAWAILIGEVINEMHFTKQDDFGEIKLTNFILNNILINKFKESHKLFNRAENLVLETIIMVTRLKTAFETKKENLVMKYQRKIEETIKSIKRFGKNPDNLKSVYLIEDYLQNLK